MDSYRAIQRSSPDKMTFGLHATKAQQAIVEALRQANDHLDANVLLLPAGQPKPMR